MSSFSWPPEFSSGIAGVSSLEGLTGTVGVTSPDGSLAVGASGQNVTLRSTSIVAPGALPATNPGNVYVAGNASLSADTAVNGDLIVLGNLTNAGGFALSVGGKLVVTGLFNFTPTLTATAQGNVTVGGDCFLGSLATTGHTFNVNPGQSPVFSVGGDLYFPNADQTVVPIFDGGGVAGTGANGLTVTVFGNLASYDGTGAENTGEVHFNGADSSTGNAGSGGTVYVGGNVTWLFLTATGGTSSFATGNGGSGGTLQVAGSSSSFGISGGGAGTGGRGGDGGRADLWGDHLCTGDQAGGGGAVGTGSIGGNGGTLNFYGDCVASVDSIISASGGNSETGGTGGTINFHSAVAGGGTFGGGADSPAGLTILIRGGGSSTAHNGGNAGAMYAFSDFFVQRIDGRGGNGAGANGGHGATVVVQGSAYVDDPLNTTMAGGSGTVAGTTGTMTVTGALVTRGATSISSTTLTVQGCEYAAAVKNSAAQTTLTGSAGTAVCSQPEQGTSYKKVVAYLSGYTDTGTQVYTFPTPFSHTPFVSGAAGPVAGATATTTTLTFTVTTQTGFVFVEGF